MSDTWQLIRTVRGGTYQNHYGEPVFDGEWSTPSVYHEETGELNPLDEIDPEIVGKAGIVKLHVWAQFFNLPFGVDATEVLLNNEKARALTWNEEDWEQPASTRRRTSAGWDPHIRSMAQWNIIRYVNNPKDAKVVCTYFAVPKNKEVNRTVFNGKYMSKHCKTPPPVNLLDIPEMLEMVGALGEVNYFFADIRHWFHQLPVCAFLSERFCLRVGTPGEGQKTSGDKYYSW